MVKMGSRAGSYLDQPVAGRRSSLHSAKDGLKVPRKGKVRSQEPVYDTKHILGWNKIG